MELTPLEKEWNKIKDFNIFDSIEDFSVVFNANPNGKCFRKYTSYPWSKENFFFGTYAELVEFYKTSTEVPFFYKNYIGRRYHKLIVQDFKIKIDKGKRVVFAKCKCDCGKTKYLDFEGITKNNIRSCGCLHGDILAVKKYPMTKQFWDCTKNSVELNKIKASSTQLFWWKCDKGHSFEAQVKQIGSSSCCPICKSIKKDNILKLYPDFVEKNWDYQLNSVDPQTISIKSTQLIWLRNENGIAYQIVPHDLFKKNNGTSFPEQAIFYYVKQFFPDAQNRFDFVCNTGEIIEIDIYIPSQNVAIEYDGYFWHKNKVNRDNYKRLILNENGLCVISIREFGLPLLNSFIGDTFIAKIDNSEGCELYEIITSILQKLNKHIPIMREENIKKDRQNIYALYMNQYKENNLTKSCLFKYYDYEGNGNLNPEMIGYDDNVLIRFICPNKIHIEYNLKSFLKHDGCENKECEHCCLNICPFVISRSRYHDYEEVTPFCVECEYRKTIQETLDNQAPNEFGL